MRLELSANVLVNAAGGLLFVLAGAWALHLGRGSARARLVGGAAVLFGATYVIQNLVRDHDLPITYAFSAIAIGAAALLAALSFDIARGVSTRSRAFVLAVGVACALALAVASLIAHIYPQVKLANGFRSDIHGSIGQASIAAIGPGIAILVAACATRFRSLDASAGAQRRALAALAMAFGTFGVFFPAFMATFGVLLPSPTASLQAAWLFGISGIATLVGALPFLGAASDRRLGTHVFLGLFAASGVALAVNLARAPFDSDLGSFGIARTVGVAFLVVGIVRYDLLGVPLPRFAARRGTLAAWALATLLIVAQVAQNWLSAQYGLLMGGVVAGALVFAANPIQRALEGGGPARAPAPAADDRARREQLYLNAARLAVRDRRLTRAEEAHLHALAEELGLGAKRAHELLVQAEGEAGVG